MPRRAGISRPGSVEVWAWSLRCPERERERERCIKIIIPEEVE
jgi:hypothetical protein